MRAILSWTILLIFMAPCIFAGKCSVNITVEPQVIKAMIDTQENFCSATVTLMPVNILNKDNVTNDCDRWALVFEVEGLLEKLNFKFGSTNHKNKETLTNTYRSCIFGVEHEEWDVVNAYLQTVQKSPIEILQRVNYSLNKLDGFNPDYDSFSGCLSFYGKSRPTPKAFKGPQCVCPSPTTPTSSSATSQTSLSKSTTIYSSYTSPLAGDMSDYYPEKNSQGLDSSPSILTSMPSDLKPSTTTVDYLHSNTIEHSDIPEVEYMKEKIYLQWVLIVTLVVFLLLFLCGFLYYSHQYRKLRRRLSVSCDVDLTRNPHAVLPEEREPFPVIECDTV
ncbi:uncharacterized protein [Eleutherodactylus coqui]|uniref:uncharacterized protein isoform X2 n=1 Tax=Eleutherodactylus coqui TaxID=57060 RepID=UPI00346315BC